MLFNGEIWRTCGYVSELKNDYQLILLHVRGHGQSDKPDDMNSYDFKTIAGDIITIMDDLNIKKAHYYGYSMGAFIGLHGIARNYLSRFNSLILGGFSVYSDEAIIRSFQSGLPVCQSAIEKGMQVYIPLIEQTGGIQGTEDLQNYLSSLNPRALYNIVKHGADSFVESAADEVLPKINLPCLAYAGEDDIYPSALKKTASKMPNAKFIIISWTKSYGSIRAFRPCPPVCEEVPERSRRSLKRCSLG